MRELAFINDESPAPDAAITQCVITQYVDMFGPDLLEEALKAIRAAVKMDNMELSKALAAMVVESGADEMEVS
jgi:hypothetical protein